MMGESALFWLYLFGLGSLGGVSLCMLVFVLVVLLDPHKHDRDPP